MKEHTVPEEEQPLHANCSQGRHPKPMQGLLLSQVGQECIHAMLMSRQA
jgi:hypothetical protein